jgi:hypothetical protein
MKCRDLMPGDLMLKVNDSSPVSKAITFGQQLRKLPNAFVVHAGIMFDQYYIVEAQRAGIVANDLRVGHDLGCGYYVFRPTNRNMAQGAAACAKMMFDIHQTGGNLHYSVPAAVGSLFGGGKPKTRSDWDALLDRILAGKQSSFFCSQFVVMVYQFVAEQMGTPGSSVFNYSDPKVNPALLAADLSRNPTFSEVGYMLPKER